MKNATTHLARSEQSTHTDIWSAKSVKELQMGMIREALEVLNDGRKSQQMKQDAKAWIVRKGRKDPFSFSSCCDANGLNASYLRWLLNKILLGGLYDSHQ